MYQQYWKMTRRPFDDAALPDSFYLSKTHQAALLKLRYLIEQRKGMGLLGGEHGLGKTLLSFVLQQEMQQRQTGQVVRLMFPQLQPLAMLNYLADQLGAQIAERPSEDLILRHLEDRLQALYEQGQHTVFVIDDAHLLEVEHLQVLRLLLNLRESGHADFTILLCGRNELLVRLTRLAALDQRIVVRCALEPLTREEILPYVQHRLAICGASRELFHATAMQPIWELSHGVPRRINQLCDLALLVGFADERSGISGIEIEAAAEELMTIAA